MSNPRAILAGTAFIGLAIVPAITIPAAADTGAAAPSSSSTGQSSASTSSTDPLVSLCITVTPKSVAVGINGQDTVVGPVQLARTCIATPF